MNLYTVHYSYPSKTGWSMCFGLQVVAQDANAAKASLMLTVPNAEIWGVDCVGPVDDYENDDSGFTSLEPLDLN